MSEQLPPPDPEAMLRPPAGSPAPQRRGTQRWLRVLAPVGIVAVALGGFAVAQAAIDDSGNDSPRDLIENSTPSTLPDGTPVADDHGGLRSGGGTGGSGGGTVAQNVTFINDAIADGATQTFSAGAAGTVTISRNGTILTVVSSAASPGWTAVVEAASGPEVEVKFTSPGARIDLEAEIEDGGVRVRVRERGLVTDPATPGATVPAVDDDHSGPGGGSDDDASEIDDDHGGSGGGSDDSPDVDDDHGGSGGGSDDSPDVDDDHGGSSGGSGSGSSGGSGSGSSGGSGSGSGGGSGHSGGSDDD